MYMGGTGMLIVMTMKFGERTNEEVLNNCLFKISFIVYGVVKIISLIRRYTEKK